jgi:parvulin-like peptidyl-prolyl isomerase
MRSSTLFLICIFSLLFINVSLAAEDDHVLAQAGEIVFRQSDLDKLLSFSPPYIMEQLKQNPERKVMLIKRIMHQKILADMARKEGFDQEAEVKEQMKYLIDDFLSKEYMLHAAVETVTVTDEEIEAYYTLNKKELTDPEQVKARHILIKVPFGASEEAKNKAMKKAGDILWWLKDGEKFETLAEQYSEDPATKKTGGELGYFPRGRMAKPFEKAAFSMKPGEISQVVETDFGYHIIQVEDRKEAVVMPFEEVKDLIGKKIKDSRVSKAVEEFVKNDAEEAGLEIFEDRIKGVKGITDK